METGPDEYLFEYMFGGETWALTVEAASEQEARQRVLAMAEAELKGVLAERIPVRTNAGPRLVSALPSKDTQ